MAICVYLGIRQMMARCRKKAQKEENWVTRRVLRERARFQEEKMEEEWEESVSKMEMSLRAKRKARKEQRTEASYRPVTGQ